MKREAEVYAAGIVQGVGFRPFVHRIATDHGLKGFVSNLGDVGVRISVEGEEAEIKGFIKDLETKAPPIASVEKIEVRWGSYKSRFRDFEILESSVERIISGSMLPSDIAICADCRDDIFNPKSRWFDYPFTVCSNCGPRFTATYELPYDRSRTNMSTFPLCDDCTREYKSQTDRRFHAQGICCKKCGPKMSLFALNGEQVFARDPVAQAMKLLDEGFVLAVKGLGGMHLATKTTEDKPIYELRRRKRRPNQPLALMSPDLEAIRTFAKINAFEETLLASWRRPIVILHKSSSYHLSDLIAPKLDTVGVMLPYSGIHLLMFKHTCEPALVMTSANRSGVPMVVDNESAFRELKGVADFLLLHNRKIANRCDDSVVRVLDGSPIFFRRSRGYVPTPVPVPVSAPEDLTVIAYGAELRNAAAILKGSKCYLTQYVGDCDNLETLDYLESAVDRLEKFLGVTSDQVVIACDLHPIYLSSRLAEVISQRRSSPLIRVQHHHAHITSLMAENGVKEPIVGIALDGVGYGPDGTIWGGELLDVSYQHFKRVAYLEPLPMPGSDLCTRNPVRMLVAGLTNLLSGDAIRELVPPHILKHLGVNDLQQLVIASRSPGVMLTSSAGRVLDAVAAALGICYKRTYEGEPAISLESVAARGDASNVKITLRTVKRSGHLVLETSRLLSDVLQKAKEHRREDVAAATQRALAFGLADIAIEACYRLGRRIVGISGGVAVNVEMVRQIRRQIEDHDLVLIQHRAVPPGDGGICLGQSVVALAQRCDL